MAKKEEKKKEKVVEEVVEEVVAVEEEAASPGMPALDAKMPLTLVMLYFSRQLDMTDPVVLEEKRMLFYQVTGVMFALMAFVFVRITTSATKDKQIWVPPKPAAANPFSPAPVTEPKSSEFEATTYGEHELGLLKGAAGQALMGFGIAMLMSFKFDIHMSVAMNVGTLPYGLWECLATRKYLGVSGLIGAGKGGAPLYGELTEKPAGWVAESNKKED